jgi:hypothetical protein
MPDVSSYKILRDRRITLTPGGVHLRSEFTLPEDTNYRARTILAFVADPSADASLTLEIEVNGTVVKTSPFQGGAPRGLWEVLGANVLEEGDNEVRFTVPGSTTIHADGEDIDAVAGGKLGISDVVLWYVRTIPTAQQPRSRHPAARPRLRKG